MNSCGSDTELTCTGLTLEISDASELFRIANLLGRRLKVSVSLCLFQRCPRHSLIFHCKIQIFSLTQQTQQWIDRLPTENTT